MKMLAPPRLTLIRPHKMFPCTLECELLAAAGEADRATAFPFRKAATEQLSKSTSVLNALEAEAEDADAAVPSTTLNTLTGLLEEEFGPAWEIPIVVRNRPSGAWAASQDPYTTFSPCLSANAPGLMACRNIGTAA